MTDKVDIEIPVTVENDLEVDSDGRFYLQTFLFPNDEDDSVESRVLFEDVIENLIEFYRNDMTSTGYGQLYQIANEFERHTDKLREVAGYMENRSLTDDIFADI
jgi:hypothetical protein